MIYEHGYDIVPEDAYLRISDIGPDIELLLKIEGLNLAGSIKLKPALSLLQAARRSGALLPGGKVVESSSGNLGVGLAMVCAAEGHHFTCITDPNASPHSVALMRAYGSEVVMVEEPDANGGYLQTRLRYLKTLLADDPGLVWLNQYANPANARAHYERTATAILAEVAPVDYLFVGAGTTGTLNGCAAYFREHSPHTRIIAVDAVGSVTFGQPAAKRRIPGLGTSRRPEIFQPDAAHEVMFVSEPDAIRMCRWLATRRGVLVGGSTGSVLAAVMAKAPDLRPGARVVAISPDLGERYLSTIYNDDWVMTHYGVAAVDASAGAAAYAGQVG